MAKAKIVATFSPCCGIFHVGDAEQGIMHCALPHDRKVVKLVDEKELETLDALKAELKNATIPAICTAWLKANGYDGLCDPEMACGCSVLDLMPCATPRLNACVPAHKELQDDDNP